MYHVPSTSKVTIFLEFCSSDRSSPPSAPSASLNWGQTIDHRTWTSSTTLSETRLHAQKRLYLETVPSLLTIPEKIHSLSVAAPAGAASPALCSVRPAGRSRSPLPTPLTTPHTLGCWRKMALSAPRTRMVRDSVVVCGRCGHSTSAPSGTSHTSVLAMTSSAAPSLVRLPLTL